MAQEKIYENKIKNWLISQGAWFIKYWGGGQFTRAGIPDILCCVNGYFVAIEVKASNGKPSDLQIYHRDKIREAGGIAIILYPEQFDEFKDYVVKLNMNNVCNDYLKQFKFDKEVKT